VFLTLQRAQFLELIGRAPGLREALEEIAGVRAATEPDVEDDVEHDVESRVPADDDRGAARAK